MGLVSQRLRDSAKGQPCMFRLSYCCNHDPATTVEHGEFIRSRIPGASMTVLDAAHIANVEQAHDYTDAVLGFLQQK